jgi:hypothetical protein
VEAEGDSAESDAAAGQQETTAGGGTEGALAEGTGGVDEADRGRPWQRAARRRSGRSAVGQRERC